MTTELTPAALITAAMAALGPPKDGLDWRYKQRLAQTIPDVYDILADERGAAAVAAELLGEHKVFATHYGGYTLEESSQRNVVVFVNEDGSPQMTKGKNPKQEDVRTERLDDHSGMGRAMQKRLDALAVGQRIVAHIILDVVNDDLKVRRLIHIKPIGPKPDGRQDRSRASGRNAPQPEAREQPSPKEAMQAVFDRLGDARSTVLKEELAKKGIEDLDELTMNNVNGVVRPLARKIFDDLDEDGSVKF